MVEVVLSMMIIVVPKKETAVVIRKHYPFVLQMIIYLRMMAKQP
jgi:hypothetical protein